ncbi:hypothetical protein BO82DRAFT_407119 [Aspergillus uvarum CBS 121591]|uniref:NAD(P)-binding protein n=1 Tax=Aspergillus uvarum CBS 121591 TaxID=1448315 RepID=A0A319D956_9EURO|nr:hypothetical protein BO82DRAFT_407119 [Aspergillus uvarum CBS 121591]PYH76502.1 hypothetical protein BO82DRAFT_407119 [Aspergillus uvarum CBS 121591]
MYCTKIQTTWERWPTGPEGVRHVNLVPTAPVQNLSRSLVPAYKVSKAALNALTVQYALSYEADGFVFMAWLQTDMGGSGADLTVSQGAKAVLEVTVAADEKSNGTFRNIHVAGSEIYRGEEIPW